MNEQEIKDLLEQHMGWNVKFIGEGDDEISTGTVIVGKNGPAIQYHEEDFSICSWWNVEWVRVRYDDWYFPSGMSSKS